MERRISLSNMLALQAPLAATGTLIAQATFEKRATTMLDRLLRDLRYSFRVIRKNPWLSAVIIGTFALGIGASVSIFTIVNSVLLRPLPYPEPQRLFVIREIVPQWTKFYPYLDANLADAQIWQKESKSFKGIAIAESAGMNLVYAGDARKLNGVRASANLLDVIGVHVARGRSFSAQADEPGHGFEILLTHPFWMNYFHGDFSVVGRTIMLDQRPYVVVGILPPSFHFPGPASGFPEKIDFIQPLNGARFYETPLIGEFDFVAIGRLKGHVSEKEALAELDLIQSRIAKLANQNLDLRAQIVPLEDTVLGTARRPLYFLFGAVFVILLIGCINIANLFLARIPSRMREAAIRISLCAGRAQILRQFLTESIVLGVIGGAFGLWIAYNSFHWLIAAAPAGIPRLDEVRIDWRVFSFALVLTLFTSLLSGILPAWRLANNNPQETLKSGSAGSGENIQTRRLREMLVGSEVALCTVLLLLAGLLITSMFHVLHVEKGFEVNNVVAANVELPPVTYAEGEPRLRFYDQVAAKTRELPGVVAAGWVSILPLQGHGSVTGVGLPGVKDPGEIPKADYRVVSPGYFQAMGIPIIAGRDFTNDDRNRHVVIVSKSVAMRFWPHENPIGKMCISYWGPDQTNEVIGVAGDIHQVKMEQAPLLMVYTPTLFAQAAPEGPSSASIVVRTRMNPSGTGPEVRQVIQAVDPEASVTLQSMTDVLAESVSARSFQMYLAVVFALCALLLAMLGVFAVVAYSVEQRKRDIGIRMAIGAPINKLRNMILRQGMTPVVAGLLVGLVVAVVSGSIIASLLFQVKPFDPETIFAVVFCIAGVSLAACWIPARKAMRVDPLKALRYE